MHSEESRNIEVLNAMWGKRCKRSESCDGFFFRNVSGTEGGGEAGYRNIGMVEVFSPSLKRHFFKLCSSYCMFCSLDIDSLQCTLKGTHKNKIESRNLLRIFQRDLLQK